MNTLTKESFEKDFGDRIQEALESCAARGFVLPLHYSIVATNGSALILRVSADHRETLASHNEGEGWRFPITMTVVDSRGEGTVFVIRYINKPIVRVH